MQKKMKWAAPLFCLLIVLGTVFGGALAYADNYPPNPPPAKGTCELAWIGNGGATSGGGTVKLDVSQVIRPEVKATLEQYNLLCDSAVHASSCTLVDNGNTRLDVAYIKQYSNWIYGKLMTGKHDLQCSS